MREPRTLFLAKSECQRVQWFFFLLFYHRVKYSINDFYFTDFRLKTSGNCMPKSLEISMKTSWLSLEQLLPKALLMEVTFFFSYSIHFNSWFVLVLLAFFGLPVTGPSITSSVWESTESNGEETPSGLRFYWWFKHPRWNCLQNEWTFRGFLSSGCLFTNKVIDKLN